MEDVTNYISKINESINNILDKYTEEEKQREFISEVLQELYKHCLLKENLLKKYREKFGEI